MVMVVLFKLAVFLKPYKKECMLGPIFKLTEAILELILPTIMALIINNGVSGHNVQYVYKMGGLMVVMAVCGFCSSLVCQYFAARASQGFGTTLRNKLFDHISSFSYEQIDKFGTPSLVNRITNDVNQLQLAVAMMIRLVIRAPFICIGAIVMSMMLDFKLSLILICMTPVFAVIIYFIIKNASPLYRKYQQKLDKIALVLRENLSGVRVIRAFSKTENEKRRFCSASDELADTGIAISRVSALLNPMTSLVINFAVIAILWAGGIQINTGATSRGVIIAFINYVTQIMLALIVVSNLIILFTKAFASASRVNEILEATSSITDNGNDALYEPCPEVPAVQFKNVSFGYSAMGDVALSDISVTINRGETVGIIGSTGSGKSTFVNLIPRFYDASSGEILICGLNVREYKLHELREKIGIVPQKAVLFTGTVAENIRWGKKNASDEEIRTAAGIAKADEFISKLPDGYNTMISRGGQNLSGGQKQRLTIARAIVSNPEILILDDSSSALDFATDAALRQNIKKYCRNTTVIIVSQRISTIKYADRIIVFEDGRVAGFGKHDELMESCGVYREICLSQLSGEEAGR